MEELGWRMTADEFGEWWALYQLEPWAEARTDVASGLVCATLANINRKESARPFGPLDFAPYLKPHEEPVEADPADFIKGLKRGD